MSLSCSSGFSRRIIWIWTLSWGSLAWHWFCVCGHFNIIRDFYCCYWRISWSIGSTCIIASSTISFSSQASDSEKVFETGRTSGLDMKWLGKFTTICAASVRSSVKRLRSSAVTFGSTITTAFSTISRYLLQDLVNTVFWEADWFDICLRRHVHW